MRIGINMGHTLAGAGTGAVGIFREVDKNREVGKRLIQMLLAAGHVVVNCTVDSSNNDLVDITRLANAQALDLFVSLHLNSFADSSANGVETFIFNGSYSGKDSLRGVAKKVNDSLVKAIGWYNRGVKEANFHVLRETNAPAILVELGFCSSKTDMDLWDTEKIAAALFEGIVNGKAPSVTPSTPPPQPPKPSKEKISVTYQTYANGRWLPNVVDMQDYAGIFGTSSQCVFANLSKGSIQYRVRLKNGKWLPWVTNRQDYAGLYGRDIDAIEMKLVGLKDYNVKYRTYCNGRWLPWVINTSDYAGIFGQSIECLQVVVE